MIGAGVTVSKLLARLGLPLRIVLCAIFIALSMTACDACATTRPSHKARVRPEWPPAGGGAGGGAPAPWHNCTEEYSRLYCLHGGKCYQQFNFNGDTLQPFCDCVGEYYGRRCEFEDSSKRYEAVRQENIQTAAISAAVTLLIVAIVFVAAVVYMYRRRQAFPLEYMADEGDSNGPTPSPRHRPQHVHEHDCCSYALSSECGGVGGGVGGGAHTNRALGSPGDYSPSSIRDNADECGGGGACGQAHKGQAHKGHCAGAQRHHPRCAKAVGHVGLPDRPPIDASTPIGPPCTAATGATVQLASPSRSSVV